MMLKIDEKCCRIHISSENNGDLPVISRREYSSHLQGFSIDSSNDSDIVPGDDIIKYFRHHDNWNNPSAVPLMLNAYRLKNAFGRISQANFGNLDLESLRMSITDYQTGKLILRGKELLKSGDTSKAVGYFDQAIDMNPNCTVALLYRSHLNIQAKDFLQARNDIKQILSIDATDQQALMLLEKLPQSLRNIDGFMKNYQQSGSNNNIFRSTVSKLQKSLSSETSAARAVEDDNKSTTSSTSSTSSSSISVHKNWKRKSKKRKKDRHKKKRSRKS